MCIIGAKGRVRPMINTLISSKGKIKVYLVFGISIFNNLFKKIMYFF